MPYQSLVTFQKAAIKAINSYCRGRRFFRRAHHTLATQLKADIVACQTQEAIIDLLYSNYEVLLTKKSKTLAKKLALLLAEAWNFDAKNVEKVQTYHQHLTTVNLIPYSNFPKYWNVNIGDPTSIAEPGRDGRRLHPSEIAPLLDKIAKMTLVEDQASGVGERTEHDGHTRVSLSRTYTVNREILYVIYDVLVPNPVKEEYKRRNKELNHMEPGQIHHIPTTSNTYRVGMTA